jgi:hypothetical protein
MMRETLAIFLHTGHLCCKEARHRCVFVTWKRNRGDLVHRFREVFPGIFVATRLLAMCGFNLEVGDSLLISRFFVGSCGGVWLQDCIVTST